MPHGPFHCAKIEKKSFEQMQSFEDASIFGQNDPLTRAGVFTKY